MNEIKLTKEEYTKLEKELQHLEQNERSLVAKLLKEAIEQGDLGENDAYTQAKDRQARLEMRIREVKQTLKMAEIVYKTNTDKVQVGSSIQVKNSEGSERKFTIVSAESADPSRGKISYNSPIGKAFMGHKKNDEIEIELHTGKKKYTILEID